MSAAVRKEMTSADENGSDQSTLQSRMMELTKLEHELPKLESLERMENSKRRLIRFLLTTESLAEARCNIVQLDEIQAKLEVIPVMETRVSKGKRKEDKFSFETRQNGRSWKRTQ